MICENDHLGGGPEQDPAPATGKKPSIKPLDTANPSPGQHGAIWEEQTSAKIEAMGKPPFGHGWTGAGLCISLPREQRPLDSSNHFTVTADGEQFAILKIPVRWLARDEAINLAAWLVAVADPDRKEFERVFEQIKK